MKDGETIRILEWDIPYWEDMTFGEVKAIERIIAEEITARQRGETITSTEQWGRILLALLRSRLDVKLPMSKLEGMRVNPYEIERDVGLLISPFLIALAEKQMRQPQPNAEDESTASPEPNNSTS